MIKGTVKWYSPKKGYGFIYDQKGKELFVHHSDLTFWTIYLNKGDRVKFKLGTSDRGQKAVNVNKIET